MRRALLIVVLGAAVIAGAAAVWAGDDSGRAPTTGSVSLIGDSLNVGIEPYLGAALPGWTIRAENEVGRATREGLAVLERDRASLGRVVVVSLGTNDPQDDARGFRSHVRRALELAGRRCLVWATIWRDGPGEALNEVLLQEARANRSLTLVEWDAMLAARPDWLAPDGMPATPAGYRARAEAVADAVRGCEATS